MTVALVSSDCNLVREPRHDCPANLFPNFLTHRNCEDNNIYCFTPKGDVFELPNGATPIDFAYKVHTRVGETMVGAIVNNQMVPLDYKLKDNDIVKINTNKNSPGPSKEWLNIVFTSLAKNRIKGFYTKIDKTLQSCRY